MPKHENMILHRITLRDSKYQDIVIGTETLLKSDTNLCRIFPHFYQIVCLDIADGWGGVLAFNDYVIFCEIDTESWNRYWVVK